LHQIGRPLLEREKAPEKSAFGANRRPFDASA
jgi:hypothetical protein